MKKDKTFDYIYLKEINKSLKNLASIDKTQNEMIINLAKRVETLEKQK